MTLKEAQKKWDDAIKMTVKHKPYSVTEDQLIKWAAQSLSVPVKVLFVKAGKTSSRIIYSISAAGEEERQKSLVPGTKVRMTGAEAEIENPKDTIFTLTHCPHTMTGDFISIGGNQYLIEIPDESSNHKVVFMGPYFQVNYDLPPEAEFTVSGGFSLFYKDFGGRKKYPDKIEIVCTKRFGTACKMYLQIKT
jgi:hypothetical protein